MVNGNEITSSGSGLSPKTPMQTCIGQHATSSGNNGPVHMLSNTVLLRSIRNGVVSDNAFRLAIILKLLRTEFHTIISAKYFYLPFSLPLNHNLPLLKC